MSRLDYSTTRARTHPGDERPARLTPPDDRPSRRALLPGLALMAAACLALAAVALYQVRWIAPEMAAIQGRIAHSFEVIKAARSLERDLADAERSARNLLVTDEAAELADYRARARTVPAHLWKLQRLAGEEFARRMAALGREVDGSLAKLQHMVGAYEREGSLAARRALRDHLGSDSLRRVTQITSALVAGEDERLAGLQARAAENERRFAFAALGAGLLAVMVMVLGALQIAQAFRNLRRAAEERRMSEERFRLFVTRVVDYAVYTMDTEGRVTSWNAGAERIKGYGAKEILGRNFARFYTAEDQRAGKPRKALDTAATEGRYETEAQRVRKDGAVFWAHVVLDPIRDDAGRLLGYVKVTRDITERRAQQEALEQARGALVQAQKMEAVGQLTGGVAHDFNNLLTVIVGSLEALERRLESGRHDVSRFVETARRGADRAADLVQRLLAFARRQPLEPRPLDPNRLVGSVAALVRRSLGESVTLETVLAQDAWWVSADESQLENAVLNLALNARDAMPRGGRLTIETANAFLDDAYARLNENIAPGEYAMIAVTDNGTGMTREQLSRAFEPFFTTKDVGQGSGLGLSQVYGFVKQSRGHVKIYSEPGAGTTVKIYLPRLQGEPPAQAPQPAAEPAERSGGSERILLVEDDEDVRAFAADALHELGYRVLQARDAASALRILEGDGRADLLFTDLGLPGGSSGRDLAEAARRLRPGLKVLFTSGYARNGVVQNGVIESGAEFVGKPFTQSALAKKVRAALDRPGRDADAARDYSAR